MHFTSVVTSLLLAGGALATDYSSGSSSGMSSGSSSSGMSSASTSATVVTHVVKVSNKNGTLKYTPNNTIAKVGEMVQFQFYPNNHSVNQAAFAQPCTPINQVMANVTGFKSGFQFVKAEDTVRPTFTVMVSSTSPVWFFCSQAKHCSKGMVGAINAPLSGAKTIEAFTALAMQQQQGTSTSTGSSNSTSSSSGSSSSGSSGTGSSGSDSGSSSGTGSSGTATSSSPPISSGGASGSLFAGSKEVYTGATLAGLVSALMAFAL